MTYKKVPPQYFAHFSMPIAFPSTAVTVIRRILSLFTTGFADKNPRFSFLNLNPKKGCCFDFTERAWFRFHIKLNFLTMFLSRLDCAR